MIWIAALGLATPAHAVDFEHGYSLGASEVGSARKFGLGLHLGTFSGLTGQYYLGEQNALTAVVGAAYGFGVYNAFHVTVTYNQYLGSLADTADVDIPWRVGVGGWLNSGGYLGYDRVRGRGTLLGARVPAGVDFNLTSVPLQFYVEVAFALVVVPVVVPGLDAGIGARWYF